MNPPINHTPYYEKCVMWPTETDHVTDVMSKEIIYRHTTSPDKEVLTSEETTTDRQQKTAGKGTRLICKKR